VLLYLLDRAAQAGYSLETKGLIAACESGEISDAKRLETVKTLVEAGANINGSDDKKEWSYGQPLSDLSMRGDSGTVKYLIGEGANVNAFYSYGVPDDEWYGRSPLGVAIDYGYLDIVKVLIENGATIPKGFDWEDYSEAKSTRIYEYLQSVAQ
jgi:ankyrin repeat protein